MSKKTDVKTKDKIEFKMNNTMSDIIFAGFAQLSYLDWHKLTVLPKGTQIKEIFKEGAIAFNQIKTDDYKNYKKSNYSVDETIHGKRIYSAKDARLFYLYSEDATNAENNPKYPDFGEWQLKPQLAVDLFQFIK